MVVFFILLFLFLLIFLRKDNVSYIILISLTFFTFFIQFLVGRSFEYKSVRTIFNTCFICINIFLIIKPWSHANIIRVRNLNVKFLVYFKKILYGFLFLNLVLNLVILILVLIFLQDIAAFKAESAYLKLYDQIPYFANIFRFAYTTQSLGYLAIPIFYFHLGNLEIKKALYAFLFSSSSLLAGFAFYSRAQIFTYTVLFIIYFFLIKKTLPNLIKIKVLKFLKYSSLCIIFLFLTITYIRFTAMDYYGDRIPETSIIKDPVVYSLFDYACQSYSNGLYQLEVFTDEKSLKGEQFFRDVYQILNFFGIINWDAKDSQDRIDRAYNYDGGAFNGYTAPLVFNFGYITALLISVIYFISIRFRLKKKKVISIESMFFLILMLVIPTVSIFYTGYALLLFPVVFLVFCRFMFTIKRLI